MLGDVELAVPVRDYLRQLVHVSVRHDPGAVARHITFIAPRLVGGLAVLATLPLYLAVRGGAEAFELMLFGAAIAPLGAACFLSQTGRLETAHIVSGASLAAAIVLAAMLSGGIASPVALWLVLVPFEAALSASRRAVFSAIAIAAGAGVLLSLLSAVLPAQPMPGTAWFVLSAAGALGYSSMLALGAATALRRHALRLDAEEQRY
ncbi:MAG: PAS domain-containing sensor histidine kinase, partial [Rhizobiales bacterium]|nr:PAS domain-containing sensor histidine kinase [Hyphomicrobiales bacterium]